MKPVAFEPFYILPDHPQYDERVFPGKDQMLRRANRYLRSVGRFLAPHGFVPEVRTNRGGILVSGEVTGWYRRPSGVSLYASVEAMGHLPWINNRTDHLVVLVRTMSTAAGRRHPYVVDGPNQYVPASKNSEELATFLLELAANT